MRAGVKEGVKELGRPLSVKEVSMAANVLRHSAQRHLLFFHHAADWIVEGSREIVQGDGESDNNQRSERTQERSERTASLNEREEKESDRESEESARGRATRNPSHPSSTRLVARQPSSSEPSTSASATPSTSAAATASTTAAGSSGCSEAESVSMCQSVAMLLHAFTAPGLLPQVIHTAMLLCIRPQTTRLSGLKLLVYQASSY
jgi:hypothetical protein